MADDDDLVMALRELGDHVYLAAPAGSDPVAAAVRRISLASAPRTSALPRALTGERHPRGRRRSPRVVLAATAVAIAVAAAVALPESRAAVARLLGIGGVRVETTRDIPSGTVDAYDLGQPVAVDRALALAPGPMVPDGVGDPTAAFAGRPEGAVTLIWAPTDDLPELDEADTTGVGLMVTAFPGAAGPPSLTKAVNPATRVEAVVVGGRPGYWISGAPHDMRVLGPGGSSTDTVRLAGNTLLWTDGVTTYRLESKLDRTEAVALAERMPTPGG